MAGPVRKVRKRGEYKSTVRENRKEVSSRKFTSAGRGSIDLQNNPGNAPRYLLSCVTTLYTDGRNATGHGERMHTRLRKPQVV